MKLADRKVIVLVENGFEDLEFWVPYMRLLEEGAQVTVAGKGKGRKVTSKSGGLSAEIEADVDDLSAADFDGIVVPGGWAPDKLRRYDGVKTLVHELNAAGKPVAMICHAGLVGISAGIVAGHRATGSLGIKDDLVNAGATWVDEAAFRDGSQVWGRVVEDIPAFCRELVTALTEAD
ncbi:MAG: type 1 glutamine amidotransferase [Anaerolineales bacterium]|nr:type 1 glutamine amidotransferase [Anaerolineales bacterium]